MTLSLDHVQRLNLYALLGAQRGSLDDIRTYWRLSDRVDLTEAERKAINLRLEQFSDNTMRPVWDPDKRLEPLEVEVSDDEARRLEAMITQWQNGFSAGMDRLWLEPLLKQLEKITQNGNAVTKAAVQAGHRP